LAGAGGKPNAVEECEEATQKPAERGEGKKKV